MIDGDNILMLYMYIILSAKIPHIFAYLKYIQFNTNHLKSLSKYGYCLSVFEISLEELNKESLSETLETKKKSPSICERAESIEHLLTLSKYKVA